MGDTTTRKPCLYGADLPGGPNLVVASSPIRIGRRSSPAARGVVRMSILAPDIFSKYAARSCTEARSRWRCCSASASGNLRPASGLSSAITSGATTMAHLALPSCTSVTSAAVAAAATVNVRQIDANEAVARTMILRSLIKLAFSNGLLHKRTLRTAARLNVLLASV